MTKCILYGDMSDSELAAEIEDLRGKYKIAAGGGVAVVVAGEGRRIEYSKANISGLEGLLKQATRERDRRAGIQVDGAIRVTFPYGGDRYYG